MPIKDRNMAICLWTSNFKNSDDIQASVTFGEFLPPKAILASKKEYHAKAKLRDAPLNLLQHLLKG